MFNQRGANVGFNADVRVMLRGDQHGIEPNRNSIFVFDRDLRLGVYDVIIGINLLRCYLFRLLQIDLLLTRKFLFTDKAVHLFQ